MDNNSILNVQQLCEHAKVSRSGFYRWRSQAKYRESKERQDELDFELLKQAYEYRGYAKGIRGIYMRLLHLTPPVVMNKKKIGRLMKKFGLRCPIRKANPYRKLAKDMQTNHVAQNILDRKFDEQTPRHIFLTDITYIPYNGQFCYLSPVVDLCTHEVLAYKLSDSLEVEFVIEMVDTLLEEHGAELDDTVLMHSDRGCHYTSKAFIAKLKSAEFVQSMSRKGNCWDNAPQESFFGHMKDEIGKQISECKTYEEVKKIIDDWMEYYNNERYQWDLDKLSPKEYSQYKLTGIYPIPIRSGKSNAL